MAIPWGSIKSLLIFFGPILLPKAIGYYRAVRNAARQHNLRIQPTPPAVSRALAVLLATALVFLVLTLPLAAPENVLATTQSRLQIPVDVLFHRLATGRPNGTLTRRDQALRARLVDLESRLLYLQFGPAALADCPFCASDDPRTYLAYAATDLLAPHLFNLVVVISATSAALVGREATSWRTPATLAAVVLAALDVYLTASYNYQANSRALKLSEIDFFYWNARVRRFLGLALLDALLGWLLWLTATNRAFVLLTSPAERVEGVVRALGGVKSNMHAVGIVKNTAIRDEELRARSQAYWNHEIMLMRDVMEEKDVIDSVKGALEDRIDISSISKEADVYVQSVLRPV